jgi:nucleoside 2-deoxyribosyltransferase
MRIYFAGPLFTPYVRDFISAHATVLREHGIEPFVPHESFRPPLEPGIKARLVAQGMLTQQEADSDGASQRVRELVSQGRLSNQEVGFPPRTADSIFAKDYEGLSAANAVVALLDGTQVDDGTACEIGIFYALSRKDPTKKGVLGFVTDARSIRKKDHGYGINRFVLGTIEERGRVLHDFDEVIAQLKGWEAELAEATR